MELINLAHLKLLKSLQFLTVHLNNASLSKQSHKFYNFLFLLKHSADTISSVFWGSYGQLLKSQEKNPHPFPCLPIFNNL